MRSNLKSGTSLVEVLVAMVVLLVGILAIAQIFPGGFRILNTNRDSLVAATYAEGLQQFYAQNPNAVPESILPVTYTYQGGKMVLNPSSGIAPKSLELAGDALGNDGVLSKGGEVLGKWDYFSGPNNLRRVMGDSYTIPQPRKVAAGAYGSVLVLRYGPILTATNPAISTQTFQPLLDVTSNDLEIVEVTTVPGEKQSFQAYLLNADSKDAELYLSPVEPATVVTGTYRLVLAYFAKDAGTNVTRREATILVGNVGGSLTSNKIETVLSAQGGLGVGESLVSVDVQSMHLVRVFNKVASFTSDPYEYNTLGGRAEGILLINPAAASTFQLRSGQRTPLQVKVSYDVLDWRIVKDEVKVPSSGPAQVKLNLPIKVLGGSTPDRTPYAGLGLNAYKYDPSTSTVGTENREMLIVDEESGDTIAPVSYSISSRNSLVDFKDSDSVVSGLQVWAVDVLGAAHQLDAGGRTFRVYYRSSNEWSTQPLKASSSYGLGVNPPKSGQYFLDYSNSRTRAYFPQSDLGQRVSVDEIWYTTDSGKVVSLKTVDFVLRKESGDTVGYPFLDLTDLVADTNPNVHPKEFNTTSYGYAMRGVHGASLTIRVLQNPGTFSLGGDNFRAFEAFKTKYSQTLIEGYQAGGVR